MPRYLIDPKADACGVAILSDCSAPYLNDLFTIPSNLSGMPALTVPCALSPENGLPIGLQLMGGYHQEAVMLDVAEWMEKRVREEGHQL